MGRMKINNGLRTAAALFLVIFAAGCGAGEADAGKTADGNGNREISGEQESGESTEGTAKGNAVGSMETEPDLTYEVPESVPNICVNQLGYIAKGDKTAVFYGRELPEEFHVVKEESGEVVFVGDLRDMGYNEARQEYNGYGDFSEVQESGTYYIESPVLGRSYSFMIGENLYEDVLKETCRQYYQRRCGIEVPVEAGEENGHEACHTEEAVLRENPSVPMEVSGGWHGQDSDARIVTEAAGEIALLLLSYELNTGVFMDDAGILESGNEIPDLLDEIRYEAEWMLKMQNAETGAVYAGVTAGDQEGGKEQVLYVEPADTETEEAFAMALAKFSYLYQEYDTDFATECLKAADRAWLHADLTEDESAAAGTGASEKGKKEWKFAAAAELYRASGKQSYHDYVSEYLSEESYWDNMDLPVMSGCVTYICTRQMVELELCEEITRVLTMRADEAAQTVNDLLFNEKEAGTDGICEKLLEESTHLILINHMISSREYEVMIENCLHYLMGRNAWSLSYIDHVGENSYRVTDEKSGVGSQPEGNGRLILVLSDILNWQKEHDGQA